MSTETALANQLAKAAQVIEDQLDTEINRLDKLTDDDLDQLRLKRMQEIKRKNEEKQGWIAAGHGEYAELQDEKEFFSTSKRSQRVVCQFYTDSSVNCKIVDKHMQILAPKHFETKFCKINAEKTPFLVEKLKIKIMPTLVFIDQGVISGQMRGFDSVGGRDDFSTEMLEWRLAKANIISYAGDLSVAPDDKQKAGQRSITGVKPKSKNKPSIRSGRGGDKDDSDSDGDNDW